MATLLEKALNCKEAKRNRWTGFDQDRFDLMYAVATGDVSFRQAAKAMGLPRSGSVQHIMSTVFAAAIRNGALVKASPKRK